jgi:hypothetical protein
MANGAVDPNDMDRSCGAVRLVFDGDYLHMGEVGADLENTYLEEHWLWPEISESLGCDDPLAIDPFDVIRYVLQRKS